MSKKVITYPSFIKVLLREIHSVLYQSAFVGVILSYAFFPLYISVHNLLTKDFGLSDQLFFTITVSLCHTIVYVLCNGTYFYFDKFKIFQQYKLPRKEYHTPSDKLINTTLLQAVFGQFISSPILTYFLYNFLLYRGMPSVESQLPSPIDLFQSFAICHLFNEYGFYFTHRLLHMKPFYALFHKQHHEYTGTVAIAAEYANPVEVLLSNVIPSVGGAVLFGGHPFVIHIWLIIRLQQTYETHSGYYWKNTIFDKIGLAHSEGSAQHDWHHSDNRGCYGSEFLDWCFGTMDSYVSNGMDKSYSEKLE